MPFSFRSSGRSAREWIGCVFLLVVYVIVKLPFLTFDGPINPDESQMLTQALTLQHDPVFWRSVDGTTAGPLNSYLIWGLGQTGLAYTYLLLHGLATALVLITLGFSYRILLLLTTIGAARTSLLVTYFFLLFSDHKDFNHFNSELASVTLLTIGLYVLIRSVVVDHSPWYTYFGLGAICGLVPLAKLQGGPLAGAYLLYAAIALFSSGQPARWKRTSLIALATGLVFILALLTVSLWSQSVLNEAYVMYIRTNLTHYQTGNGWSLFVKLVFKSSYDYVFLLGVSGALWALAAFIPRPNLTRQPRHRVLHGFLWVTLLLSFWVVARTGYVFEHYLFYTFLPITCLNGYALDLIGSYRQNRAASRLAYWHLVAVVLLGQFGSYALKRGRSNQHFSMVGLTTGERTVINQINLYAKRGDCLAIWGWNCRYYIATGLWQAARENHSIRCMTTNSLGALHNPALIKWYCQQYVLDLRRNRPVVFVDEVRANTLFADPEDVTHEMIPDLRTFVRTNYQLVSEQDDIRVYIRSDRLNNRLPRHTVFVASARQKRPDQW